MEDVKEWEFDKLLWKARPTPLDNTVREILSQHDKTDFALIDFTEVYLKYRSILMMFLACRVISRRRNDYQIVGSNTVVGAIWIMNIITYGMRDGILTEKVLQEIKDLLTIPQQPDNLVNATLPLLIKHNLHKGPRYLYRRPLDWMTDKWYRYVSKAFKVYNVPRDDLLERQLRKQAEIANRQACIKKAEELISSKSTSDIKNIQRR